MTAAAFRVFPDDLLASSVNGGGVFLIADANVERISPVDTTGVAITSNGAIWARQAVGPAELRRVTGETIERVVLAEAHLDLHDVLLDGGRLYVVATETNTLFELDAVTYAELRRWTLPGEADSQHLNSVCIHDGRVLVSRFGDFDRHRGYKGRTRGAGQVLDVETGEIVVGGLSQAHSLTSMGGLLWLCDSEAHRVCAYRDFVLAQEIHVGGYARGLAFGDTRLYVGISRSRNEANGATATAAIASFELDSLRPAQTTAFPANEIYDLVIVAGALDALRRAGAQDTLLEVDQLRHARNQGAMALHAQHVAHAELDGLLQASRAENAFLAKQLRVASEKSGEDENRKAEDAQWTDLLQTAVGQLSAAIVKRERLLAARDVEFETLAEGLRAIDVQSTARAARIDAMSKSRSWRWTRWLRSDAPGDAHRLLADQSAVAGQQDASHVQRARELAARGADHPALGTPQLPHRSMVPVLGLSFVEHGSPEVSIVVTAFGNFEETRACLTSIQRAGDATSFEIILIEDHSGDEDMGRFAQVPGLRYVEHAANLGYLRSVNQAATLARGKYLHLLNNDTRVMPGWLDALRQTFDLFHECGLAGSKLISPDGSLQEAGGIVWSDGSACNYGRGEDPSLARHSVVREVDYVSGASIMLPTQRFIDLGGYDERYLPAYYEDTDLAFRIRAGGSRVYVQPSSLVIHNEGMSHGTDTGTGIKAHQVGNRDVFAQRWGEMLPREQMAPGEHVFLARDRAQLKQIVLLVERYPPQPDHDAGSRAIWQLMRVLFLQGLTVKFWMHESGHDPAYEAALRAHGIEVFGAARDGSFDEWLRTHGPYIDHVILSRPLVAQYYIRSVRRHSIATVTYYGHDIHHLRIGRQAELQSDAGLAEQSSQVQGVEHALWRAADLVLYPSDEETAEVREYQALVGADGDARTVPLYAFEGVQQLDDADGVLNVDRDLLLFVGGFSHAPNADAVLWFAREIWPLVHARHPSLRLCLAGAQPGEAVAALASVDIEVTGYISEAELHARYRRARVAIAPLRFGAGTKGKVIEAMWHGVPCVTTTTGQQGLRDADSLRVADTAPAMADEICLLVENAQAWRQASRDGQEYVLTHFSVQSVWSVLQPVLAARGPVADVAARRLRLLLGGPDPTPADSHEAVV